MFVKCCRWEICVIVRYLLDQKENKIPPASETIATVQIAPKICQVQPPQYAHSAPDFIEISSLSAQL